MSGSRQFFGGGNGGTCAPESRVQEVLDTYWPKTTELTNIKRDWSNVYTAILENGQKCIVKAGINNKEGSGARSSG